ncbi:MAG: mRNA cleavage and polyadenylation factor subunit [Icmadophila ericetorum]|nr:mRNA cleavage and polyadenylation factor subunit [Icmadophila ericetorum]
MAMQCYTDLIAPTAVTHSVSLPFLSSTANNLVIAKSSLLQIFSFKSIIANAKDGAGSPEGLPSQNLLRLQTGDLDSPLRTPRRRTQRSERTHTTKFVLVAQYELSGTVIGLARVKTMRSKSGGEALLVALRNAKLSLLEWDPERYCMSTVSIHYYEREDLQGSPWSPQQSSCVNYLAVDPSSRCAALKFGARSVAILPFHQAGDDLVMDDYDPEFDINASKANKSPTKTTNGESATSYTPYGASFALSLLMLDSNLDHPIHLAFLHEYREPTFGVLSSRLRISSALLHERQEMVSYTVYTLDLEQRASTTLLSIPALPYDLHTVLPLPLPIGGALLVGFNELIHVDQAGKTNGIAVNEFAKQSSSFPLAQQSGLDLKLEGCIVEHLGTPGGEMLLLLQTGDLVTLEFKRDGRSISGLLLHALSSVEDGFRLKAAASCVSNVGRGRIFVGSEEGDSLILGWSRKSGKLQQRRVSVKMEIDNEGDASDGEEDDVEDDDDLYAESKPAVAAPVKFSLVDGTNEADDYTFRIHDTLRSLAPFVDLVFAASEITGLADERPHSENPLDPQLMASIGKGRAGAICKLSRRIIPDLRAKYELEGVNGVWPLSIKKGSDIDMDQGLNVDELDQRCNFMIISRTSPNGNDQAFAFSLLADAEGIDRQLDEFDSDTGLTVDIGIFAGGTRVIHVVKSEVRTYDNDLGLAQIFPMADDDSAPGPKIIAASFAEPYILLIRDDDSAMVLKAEESGDLEEVEGGALFQSTPWVSGSLFDDSNDIFRLESDEGSDDEAGNILMFLLSAGGGLKIFRISDLDKPIYTADGLSFLPPFLSAEFTGRRSTARETLVDILVSELGDATAKAPFMILQSANNDITIYQPFQCPVAGKSITTLRFVKLSIPRNLEAFEDGLENGYHEEPAQILRAIQDLNGYSAVCVSGPNPSLIIKSASSLPKIIPLKLKGIRSLSGFHTQGCPKGLIYVDLKGFVHAAQLPQDSEYSTGWVTQQVYAAGENIDTFEYHPTSDRYVLGTSEKVVFKLPDDELHYEWSLESE